MSRISTAKESDIMFEMLFYARYRYLVIVCQIEN